MNIVTKVSATVVVLLMLPGLTLAQWNASVEENAALPYWSAFSQLQDAGITDQQANKLNALLDGTAAYDDSTYKDLLAKNALPLQIMTRATSIPRCEWGLDYTLKENLPVDYARKALVLGRLNVLNTFHLAKAGDTEGAVRSLVAGLKFSRDVANGGSLFAAIVAKVLLVHHLRAATELAHLEQLSIAQRSELEKAVTQLGPSGVDWQVAIRREIALLNTQPWPTSASQASVMQAYIRAVDDPSRLESVEQLTSALPQALRSLIPNPKQVVQQKQDLDAQLLQARRVLQ